MPLAVPTVKWAPELQLAEQADGRPLGQAGPVPSPAVAQDGRGTVVPFLDQALQHHAAGLGNGADDIALNLGEIPFPGIPTAQFGSPLHDHLHRHLDRCGQMRKLLGNLLEVYELSVIGNAPFSGLNPCGIYHILRMAAFPANRKTDLMTKSTEARQICHAHSQNTLNLPQSGRFVS